MATAPPNSNSAMLPTYLQKISDPSIRTVLLTGTGGGFDFVHSVTLIPELRRLGKNIVIGSYSFGDPLAIKGGSLEPYDPDNSSWLTICDSNVPHVKLVTGNCIPDRSYGPEVGLCQFLDMEYPQKAPHSVYAYYARAFAPKQLTKLYTYLCHKHQVDAIICFDGGSDSLMVGDEEGLGDPIEDATTIATCCSVVENVPRVQFATLIAIGLGCDRFNGVSDNATIRAIAELSRPASSNGFWGSVAIEHASPGGDLYKRCIDYLQKKSTFRSVIANSIVESANGAYGSQIVPESLIRRVKPGDLFLWPFMAFHFAFDTRVIANRSKVVPEIRDCDSVGSCHEALSKLRRSISLRVEEPLPGSGGSNSPPSPRRKRGVPW